MVGQKSRLKKRYAHNNNHRFTMKLTRATKTKRPVMGHLPSLLTVADCKLVGVLNDNTKYVGVADTLSATEDPAVIYCGLWLLDNDTVADGNTLGVKSVASGGGWHWQYCCSAPGRHDNFHAAGEAQRCGVLQRHRNRWHRRYGLDDRDSECLYGE